MNSFWRKNILGQFMPHDNNIGLDYMKLLEDPMHARATYYHELVHSVLMNTTEFGISTVSLYQNLPYIDHFDLADKNLIERCLYDVQELTQEKSATLMEILMVRKNGGKTFARNWAKSNLNDKYYNRYKDVDFILDMSKKYREMFTMKIPHLAMHNGFRQLVVENNLLENRNKFTDYMENWNNVPDIRFHKLVRAIKKDGGILKMDEKEICSYAGIEYFPDTSKKTVSDFLNYLNSFTKNKYVYTEADIQAPPRGKSAILRSNNTLLIGNMNLGIVENGIMLWNVDDLLHYEDVIETLFVGMVSDRFSNTEAIKQKTGKNPEAFLIAFTKRDEKYLFTSNIQTITNLMNQHFKATTLISKWGMYKPGNSNLEILSKGRSPEVVIYNGLDHLSSNFEAYFNNENKAQYFYISMKGHPFRTIVLKDNKNVLHMLNTFGNVKIEDFIKDNLKYLKGENTQDFLSDPIHFNNACSVWMGIDWNLDFFNTLCEEKRIERD